MTIHQIITQKAHQVKMYGKVDYKALSFWKVLENLRTKNK